jgi:hypothetical protein
LLIGEFSNRYGVFLMARAKSNTSFLIYSTITNDTQITEWLNLTTDGKVLPTIGRRFTLRGGAGVANKRTLVTPLGVMTEASADEMDFLNNHVMFKQLVATGWVKVVKATGWQNDVDGVVADMKQRDGSAPLVPNDFSESTTPKTGGGQMVTEPTMLPRSVPLPGIGLGSMFR